MGGEGVHFERDLHLIEELGGFIHHGQVGDAAHDDADLWGHPMSFL